MGVRGRLPIAFVAAAVILALAHSAEIRARAEVALGEGMPRREAALGRGFVLGEDDGVDPGTKEDFRRSGLSHLLAVSGQNVALLGLLAMPLLAAFGMPLRSRLFWILGLIVVYVPLAGAGPSILRAGIMGGLSILATLAGRRTPRLHALAIAAGALLAIEPRIAADVGWQLSFAAVLGILLFATPLRKAIGEGFGDHGWRRPFVDGAAMTIAATLATAPLIAFHFEGVSTTTLFANLLALPAVAPAMWLGMLVTAAGQVPGLPVEPLNSVNALLLAYIAQIAAWCGRPGWAYLHVQLTIVGLLASYLALVAGSILALRLGRTRQLGHARHPKPAGGPQGGPRLLFAARRRLRVGLVAGVALALALALLAPGGGGASRPIVGLRVSVLDVGQGDAILLQPRGGPAVLVDGGPPGDGLATKLRDAGVKRLGAVVVTHDQSDHAGGVRELFGAMPIGRVLYGVLRRSTFTAALAARIPPRRLAGGAVIRSGRLRLTVLWPPAELLAGPPAEEDPNRLAVVMLARWRSFSMLLAADAEAEATPLEPGPIDVLKVAHHGSDDAGLGALLDRTRPSLAVISVGAGNPFGHPTPATLATLAAHGIPTLRTDTAGTLVLEVGHGSIQVRREG
ncbi:MAG TPA: ComEC/Rec2 family competence protein [Solirubrobacterales bacterium]|nr:ComEC/Rec2 family competence protein [Solirubrobacterales bacterium]